MRPAIRRGSQGVTAVGLLTADTVLEVVEKEEEEAAKVARAAARAAKRAARKN